MDEEKDANEAAKQIDAKPDRNIAIYPLAIPLLAGPAEFVTTIVFSSRVDTMGDFATFRAAVLAGTLVVWMAMAFAAAVARFLNETVTNIGTKVLGILLAAIAIEMTLTGIDAHFIPLVSSS